MSDLPKKIFAEKKNDAVVHSALVWYQASKRRGTHSTKTRGEVRGGGRKPWKQKGTGRARAGSIRSPLWKKGGVIFGPKPRDYGYSLPKKVRKLALRVALSDQARAGNVVLAESLKIAAPKTKEILALLKKLKVEGKSLFIISEKDEIFDKSSRNIRGVTVCVAAEINIFDLLNADKVIVDKKSIAKLEEALV